MNINQVPLYKSDLSYIDTNLNQDSNIKQNNEINNSQSIFSNTGEENTPNNEAVEEEKPVSFFEGLKLFGKGIINKAKDMVTSIVQHPIKTALAVGGTALAISALPLIGISAATGAAALALGFAGYAVVKTTGDVIETVKDNNEGRYNEVREDLEGLGKDAVDLAMSLPFAPKAIKQISRTAKYGKSTIGINSELIEGLKNNKEGISGIAKEFAKANTRINYEMIGNEMGLAVKPKLEFADLPSDPQKIMMAGEYEPTTGTLRINENMLYGKGKAYAKLSGIQDMEVMIRHELEHFRQFSDIARSENLGIEGLKNTLTEYYTEAGKKLGESNIESSGISKETYSNMTKGDRSAFNSKFYQDIIDSKGTISSGTKEAEMAQKYAQGLLEKINPNEKVIAEYKHDVEGLSRFNPFDQAKIRKAELKAYKANILEKEAYAAQDAFAKKYITLRPGAANDIIMAASLTDDIENKK